MVTREKFLIKSWKERDEFITSIIHVNKRGDKMQSLFGSEVVNGTIVRNMIVWSIGTENRFNNVVKEKQ